MNGTKNNLLKQINILWIIQFIKKLIMKKKIFIKQNKI